MQENALELILKYLLLLRQRPEGWERTNMTGLRSIQKVMIIEKIMEFYVDKLGRFLLTKHGVVSRILSTSKMSGILDSENIVLAHHLNHKITF